MNKQNRNIKFSTNPTTHYITLATINTIWQNGVYINIIMLNKLNRPINRTNQELLRLFIGSQMICMLPIIITSLSLLNDNFSQCLLISFNTGDPGQIYFGQLFLGEWLAIDAYIKLAVLVGLIFFRHVGRELACDRTIVVISACLIRFFYLFDLGWTIAASALFWGRSGKLPDPTYVYCSGSPFQGYIFFLLIFSYIIIPLNLMLSGFRSNNSGEADAPTDRSRGNTQLITKNEQLP